MRDFLAVTRALSDPNRVRTVMFLRGGELCVCQIIKMLRLAPSTVSKHMAVLYNARLVETRKGGRWVYYRLSNARDPVVRGALDWARRGLARDKQVLADARDIKAVRKIDREKLCARYNRSCARRGRSRAGGDR